MPKAEDWRARIWREFHADNLTRAYRDVLLTLATYRGHGGAIHPAHETLAARAKCCERTVRRALKQAQRLALVSWVERRVRAAWRWLRTSNAYRLHVPADPVQPRQRPARTRRCASTGQMGRGGESLVKKEAQERERRPSQWVMAQAAAALPDLLAARRAAFAATWQRQHGARIGVSLRT